MAVYYFTISALAGLGYVLTEKKKEARTTVFYLASAFLLLTFVTSFRYAIGFDYFSYRNIYEIMSRWTFGDILRVYWYEPFFFLTCKLFCLAGCSYPVFLLGINIFLIFTAMQFIYRYSKIPWVSVYLYITLQFLAYNMNLIRQSIAAAFFLLAYPYLKNRKIVPFTMLMSAGGLFHNSLLFVWPLYFLLAKKYPRKFLAGLIILAVLGYVFFDPLFYLLQPVIPHKYAVYQESYFWNSNAFEYVLPSAVYGILVYLFRNRIAEPMRRRIYLSSALYNFLISLFVTKHFILERFAIYPFVFSLIAIPEIIDSFHNGILNEKEGNGNKRSYYLVLLLFLLFGAAYFLFAAVKGFHHVYPYVSLLDKSYSVPD